MSTSNTTSSVPTTNASTPLEAVLSRFQNQRDFYSKSSAKYKNKYLGCRLAQIVLSGLLPVVLYFKNNDITPVIGILIGATITITEAVQHLYQYQSLWFRYRTILEKLKKERALFDANAGIYFMIEQGLKIKKFAEKIEAIIEGETTDWASLYHENQEVAK